MRFFNFFGERESAVVAPTSLQLSRLVVCYRSAKAFPSVATTDTYPHPLPFLASTSSPSKKLGRSRFFPKLASEKSFLFLPS
ncbi:hypothetical protein CIPAW_04G119300 [Carya illinoinensis]|uniref:Uncharacterized protein n=1 Tax=Carya illinoinensis TaxID=32201 RepID=A0A8T1QSB6_CARIL|nr:hypothetical protein CIPAW_04G119300 [Carya illinoinensis]